MSSRTQKAKMSNIEQGSTKIPTPFHSNQSDINLQNSDVSKDRYFFSLNNSNTVDNDLTSTMVISYQRVKRFIVNSSESSEVQLKIKEQILNQLKSIDIAKFSFPNE
jgi:hypothetical protein